MTKGACRSMLAWPCDGMCTTLQVALAGTRRGDRGDLVSRAPQSKAACGLDRQKLCLWSQAVRSSACAAAVNRARGRRAGGVDECQSSETVVTHKQFVAGLTLSGCH